MCWSARGQRNQLSAINRSLHGEDNASVGSGEINAGYICDRVSPQEQSLGCIAFVILGISSSSRSTKKLISVGCYLKSCFGFHNLLLPAHCLVGKLSHSIELLLHLVFSALTPMGWASPHISLTQVRSPKEREWDGLPCTHPSLTSLQYILLNKMCGLIYTHSVASVIHPAAQRCWSNFSKNRMTAHDTTLCTVALWEM